MNNQTLLIECSDGYYGDKCHIACGKYLHERGCDRLNGTCYHGCKKHFKEPECTGKKYIFLHITIANSMSKLLFLNLWCLFSFWRCILQQQMYFNVWQLFLIINNTFFSVQLRNETCFTWQLYVLSGRFKKICYFS